MAPAGVGHPGRSKVRIILLVISIPVYVRKKLMHSQAGGVSFRNTRSGETPAPGPVWKEEPFRRTEAGVSYSRNETKSHSPSATEVSRRLAVIRAHSEEQMLRPIPLIENFLDHVLMRVQTEPYRPLVRNAPRVALHLDFHLASFSRSFTTSAVMLSYHQSVRSAKMRHRALNH
jgi:hypothetical protein